jgi:predicted lysophospholipase L1 biosynthesis ABC-type transport system permease subunit
MPKRPASLPARSLKAVGATSREEAGAGTRRFIDRLGQMLLLVALSALAIGDLGMSAAAPAASRRPSIAVLKLVGASRRPSMPCCWPRLA